MASPAQIEANRRNALKSTGPRTAEGKEISRRNALKHGLAAETLVLPEEEAEVVAARVAAWTPSLAPKGEYDKWLVGEAVVHSVRIDRCRAHEQALRNRQARRAALCWDDDHRAEAEELGARLAKAPTLVSARLLRTRHGCDWLVGRWEGLRDALEAGGDWDEKQVRLAMDLLGTPIEFREGPSPLDGDRKALVAAQIGRIEARGDGALREIDELERAAAEVGLAPDLDKAVALARRYEAACVRRMEWALKRIGQGQTAATEEPRPAVFGRLGEQADAEPSRPASILAREAPADEPLAPTSGQAYESKAPIGRPATPVGNRKARRAQRARARRA